MGEESVIFAVPSKTITPTSPNTDVVTTPSGDTNNTTHLAFEYQGRIPVWTPVVSQAQPQVVLGGDITIGSTTWKKGITVQYSALGADQYTVTITSGEIVDDRGAYSLNGLTLGIFPIGSKSKGQVAAEAPKIDTKTLKVADFTAISTVNTPTSANSNVVTTPSGDTNNTTFLSFQYQGRIPIWTPIVSQAQNSAVLGEDRWIGSTIWKKGITVQYSALGSTQYTVTITEGEIIDDGALYKLNGLLLGIFPIG